MIRLVDRLLLTVATALVVTTAASAENTVDLTERPTGDRVIRNDVTVEVDGALQTRGLGGVPRGLKLEVRSKYDYRARRLPPAGRDAQSLREVRLYDTAEARIDVEGTVSTSDLADDRRTFVVDGLRTGVRAHAPDFALSSRELNLLDVPGDPLAVVATLPGGERRVGDEWAAPDWAVQMLAGLEALEKAELPCKFSSLEENVARIDFVGTVKGAVDGSVVDLSIEGHYLFDVAKGFVTYVELTQRDERTIGPVSPGLDIKAKVVVDRAVSANETGITADYARGLPLEPRPRSLLVAHQLPWDAELLLDRTWHVFHQTKRVAFLRCLRGGSLLAQCNVTRVDSAAPGKHTDVERFRDDVVRSLGEKLDRIESTGNVDFGDGRFVHRVVASGRNVAEPGEGVEPTPMTWSYFLVAAPSGRQLSFMFVTETSLRDKFAGADEALVRASRFVDSRSPTRAASRDR